jgi:predicted nucleotidyltransferase
VRVAVADDAAGRPPLDPLPLLRELQAAGIDYVLIGGFAVNVYGVIRPSKDLDIVPSGDADNLDRLAALLARIEARHVGLDDFDPGEFPFDPTRADDLRQGANFRLETSLGDLDLMQWVPGVDADHAYAELASRARRVDIDDIALLVCSLADLRKMKQAAGRPRDLDDLEKLSALDDG